MSDKKTLAAPAKPRLTPSGAFVRVQRTAHGRGYAEEVVILHGEIISVTTGREEQIDVARERMRTRLIELSVEKVDGRLHV